MCLLINEYELKGNLAPVVIDEIIVSEPELPKSAKLAACANIQQERHAPKIQHILKGNMGIKTKLTPLMTCRFHWPEQA